MRKKYFRRIVSLVLALAVFVMFPMAFTQEAQAASKTKTFYVVTQQTTTYTNSDGSTEKNVTKYTYDKNGLRKTVVSKGYMPYYKAVYTRNKAGLVTSYKSYNEDGKLTWITSYTIKNGKIVKSKDYQVDPDTGKKTLFSSTTITYKKGKPTKEVTKYSDGDTSTLTYYSNGAPKKEVSKGANGTYIYNYNKKGNMTSSSSNYTSYDGTKMKSTSTYTYRDIKNKKGDTTKFVVTEKRTENGKTKKIVNTSTYQYTYKSGRMAKVVTTTKSKGGDYEYTNKTTTTYKYKAVKVAKKYWKYFE